jgi:hemin uptake protein HemP
VGAASPASPGRHAASTPTASTPPAESPHRPAARAREPIASETLFAGEPEVQIAHRGSLYRLRQTALGKLILTK